VITVCEVTSKYTLHEALNTTQILSKLSLHKVPTMNASWESCLVLSVSIEEDDMGGACSTHGTDEK
jgi:hypothetical protein